MNEAEKNRDNACLELSVLLDKFDWFHSAVVEGSYVCVYMTHMNAEITKLVPEFVRGVQVKLGFSAYLDCEEKYKNEIYFELEREPKESELELDTF